uniref:Uncharacterized protein n=1 Tax=Kalanchoe fedtschenkoi TaxID=63787 RepID=A0A7N0T0Z5_KALFE
MAWRSGSLSRSLISAARTCSPTLPRARPPPLSAPRLTSRRLSFLTPRSQNHIFPTPNCVNCCSMRSF